MTDLHWKSQPIRDCIIFCPKCFRQHFDVGEWYDRPHRTHKCDVTRHGPGTGCGHEWSEVDAYPTRGIPAFESSVADFYGQKWFEKKLREKLAAEPMLNQDAFCAWITSSAGLKYEEALELFTRWAREQHAEFSKMMIAELQSPQTLAEFGAALGDLTNGVKPGV